MLGAIIGDIAGSRFQLFCHKSKDFRIFHKDSYYTDDTAMTLAIAKAVLDCKGEYSLLGVKAKERMIQIGRSHPHLDYGARFYDCLFSKRPKPYGNFGNGSAMRINPIGYLSSDLEKAKAYSKAVTEITHNHPEGLKGAEAVAMAICLARRGESKERIKEYISTHYYEFPLTLDEIRPGYDFDVTCQGSVPVAFLAFFEATSFEDCIRTAVSVGGDSDTIAAIAGSIAEAYYGIPLSMREKALTYLEGEFRDIVRDFEERYPAKILP